MPQDDQLGTVEAFTRELGRALEPLVDAVEEGPDGIATFLEEAGFEQAVADGEADKIVSSLEAVAEPAAVLGETVLADDPSIEDVDEVIEAIASISEAIQGLDDLQVPSPDVEKLGTLLLDHLLVTYLDTYHRTTHNLLALVGVIVESDGPGAGDLDLSSLETVLKNPNELPKELFNWANEQEDFLAAVVLYYLKGICWSLGMPASIESATAKHVEEITGVGALTDLAVSGPEELDPQLKIPVLSYDEGGPRIVVGVKLVPLPGKNDTLPGLAVVPFGKLGTDNEWPLGNGWSFNVSASGEVGNQGLGVRPTKSGGLDTRLMSLGSGSSPAKLHGEATLERSGSSSGDGSPKPVLAGQPEATRIVLNSVGVTGRIDYQDDDLEVGVELPTSATLIVQPSGGFLEKVLPDDVTSDIDVTAGWSNVDGIYFEGGATLEVTLPKHVTLGPIELKEIYLSIGFDAETGTIVTQAAASATVTLGPITGTVDRMGLSADLSFPENRDGNMGPVDLELGFKPPEGVGLAIEAGAVTGGGYLFFDPENERYAGAAQLSVPGGINIAAVGLITTELPDGSDGFSMLVVVAGEFPPVQLGFGFTLDGVGGLLGINRKFRKDPLRNAVRKGNLNSILFPAKELIKNNPRRLISDLRSIFPPTRGTHVFGPMVKIGYGTPPIMMASLGVVLELPSFRIAILGRFEVALPSLEAEAPDDLPEEAPWPPIELNLDVAGVIDVPGKSISVDASLYDSRVVQWTVEGDMALRSRWGERSKFLLSVGGFNPRYTPPKSFPSLDRVKVSLDVPGGQPVVEFTGYFAVTSNTVQVGAGVYAALEAGKLSITGRLGFDALFEFDPFKFVFDFYAQFRIAFQGHEISAGIDGTVSGPTPFNVSGKAHVEIGPMKASARFDITLGPDPQAGQLPASEVVPELVDALGRPKNWDAQLPQGGESLVTLRDAEGARAREQAEQQDGGGGGDGQEAPAPVLAHPLGTVTVRQTVVPLAYTIEKFGESRPTTYHEFEIRSVSVAGASDDQGESVDGEFAPAKYRKMSDAEKMDSEDFVELPAGTTVREADLTVGGEHTAANATSARFTYEERLTDEKHGHRGVPLAEVDPAEAAADTGHSAHTAGALSRGTVGAGAGDGSRFSVRDDASRDGDGLFEVTDRDFVVVEAGTLRQVDAELRDVDGRRGVGRDGDASDSTANLRAGTSKEAARNRLKEYARTAGVDEDDLQVVPQDRLEEAHR